MKRREFVKGLSIASVSLSLPSLGFAQAQLRTTQLGNKLSLISGAGCNVVVAEGPESLVVIDGGLEKHAEVLSREINKIAPGKPISTLFNTNWRPEHIGLNERLGGTSTNIIAHENTRLWQGADFYVDWEDKHYKALAKDKQANRSFYITGTLILGDEIIEYGHLSQAHTDGDIYVRFINANILVVSDLLAVDTYPVLDYVTGGWIGGLQGATNALLEMSDDSTKIVAAEGVVQNKSALQAQNTMLTKAYEGVSNAFKTGRSVQEFKDSRPMAEFESSRGDASLFLSLVYQGTWYHVPGRAVPGII